MKNVIYALLDPTTKQIKYIGQALNALERLAEHMKPRSREAKSHKNNWLNSLVAQGLKPELIVLESFEDPYKLNEAEIFWIAYYRSIGANLTNGTDGGEGNLGWKPTEENLENMRTAAQNRDNTNYQNPHNKKEHIFIDGIEMRSCIACSENKSLDNFFFLKNQDKYHPYCKSCNASRTSEWRKNNPIEKLTEQELSEIRKENSKKSSITLKQMYKDNPERKEEIAKSKRKPVKGISIDQQETIIFGSALEAKTKGFHNVGIGKAIKTGKPYKGYIWSFA